jgi:hypothetical protein
LDLSREFIMPVQSQPMLVSQIVRAASQGEFALPPWQRGDVWTLEQRVALLDSMARGLPIGAVLTWRPDQRSDQPRVDSIARPLTGCPAVPGAHLLLDGRQRLTTILMAARGELPVYWDGERWGESGFVSAELAVTSDSRKLMPLYLAMQAAGHSIATIDVVLGEAARIASSVVTFLEIADSDVERAAETYRRIATAGSAHSVEDLRAMEQWISTRGTA